MCVSSSMLCVLCSFLSILCVRFLLADCMCVSSSILCVFCSFLSLLCVRFLLACAPPSPPRLALQGEHTVKVWGEASHGSVSLSWMVAEADPARFHNPPGQISISLTCDMTQRLCLPLGCRSGRRPSPMDSWRYTSPEGAAWAENDQCIKGAFLLTTIYFTQGHRMGKKRPMNKWYFPTNNDILHPRAPHGQKTTNE